MMNKNFNFSTEAITAPVRRSFFFIAPEMFEQNSVLENCKNGVKNQEPDDHFSCM